MRRLPCRWGRCASGLIVRRHRTDADRLRRAQAIIADRDHWCQGTFARDSRGFAVHARSHQAVQWCAVGAAMKSVRSNDDFLRMQQLLNEAAWLAVDKQFVAIVNDAPTGWPYEDVLAVYDRAIELAEAGLGKEVGL